MKEETDSCDLIDRSFGRLHYAFFYIFKEIVIH